MNKLWRYSLVPIGIFIVVLFVILSSQLRHYRAAMVLAQIDKGKLAVSQKKAIDALVKAHNSAIAIKEGKIAEQSKINAEAQAVISSVKVSTKQEIVALRQSSKSWEDKFSIIEVDYNLSLDKNGKLQGLVEGLKLEIAGYEDEVATLKQQKVDMSAVYEKQREAWKTQLAKAIVRSSRSWGIVVGPAAMFGIDGKMHYGGAVTIGWRLH